MTFAPDLATEQLAEDLLKLLQERPLDELVDVLAGAFRRAAAEYVDDGANFYLTTALELETLKQRDFELSEIAAEQLQSTFLLPRVTIAPL